MLSRFFRLNRPMAATRCIEPWYMAYALSGITVTGVTPILLPLAVSYVGSAMDIGLVMAVMSLGGLLAPLWGRLADRYRLHRSLLVSGFVITAVGLAVFPFTHNRAVWLGLALLQGLGASAASTVANLFVVEAHPEAEWDERIAWLRTFYDGGHVGGLLLAAWLSQVDLRLGMLAAASLTLVAAIVGWLTTSTPPNPLTPKPTLLHPARHGEWARLSPQHLYHHAGLQVIRQLAPALQPPFGRFLLTWMVSLSGSSAFFALYPVLAQEVFGIAPTLSSLTFALAVSLRLVLYAPAGRWSHRFGPTRLLQGGLGVRLLAFVGIYALGLAPAQHYSLLALLGFALVILCWALLSVSSTVLTAHLSPDNEGEGMGLFNAITALAGVLGAALGGWLATQWGYHATSGLAVASLTIGLSLSLTVRYGPWMQSNPSVSNG